MATGRYYNAGKTGLANSLPVPDGVPMPRSIPLARPNTTQAEIDAVVEVLRTPHLSLGPKMREFEAAFADYCGTDHAIACL